ncbi:TniQ family protein [Vibrio sp. RC27]
MFLQRPKPFPDESLESYFIRVANKNGYQDVHRFLYALKNYLLDIDSDKYDTFPTDIKLINPCHSKNHSTSRTHALQAISQLTFNVPGDVLSLAINRSSKRYSPGTKALIRGAEIIPRSLIRNGNIPVCPLCLRESGYASYLWHFEGYDVCHKHGCALTASCACGEPYDYQNNGLSGECCSCGNSLPINTADSLKQQSTISNWLSGADELPLPDIPVSFRWGLLHWWKKASKSEYFDAMNFYQLWEDWPESIGKKIQDTVEYNLEYRTVSENELTLRDVLGSLLFTCILLPDRNLKYNLILRELFHYLEQRIWEDNGQFANLRMNAIDAAILLNSDLEQIASLVDQRILVPSRNIKNNEPLNKTANIFYLGDVYCLWLAEFQTDEFNRSFYVSRW